FSAPSVTTLSSSTAVVSTLVQQYFYSPISVLVLSAIATVLIFAFLYQRYQSTAASPSTDSNIIVDSSTTLNMLKMRAKPKGETSAATGACRRKGGGGGGGAPPLTLKLDVLGKVHTIDYENQSLVDLSTMERMPKHYDDAAAGSETKLMTHLYDDAKTILESLERGCSLNGSGNCLGRIEQSTKSVSWWNYNSVMERVAHFGDGLYQLLGGDEFISGRKGEAACVGIYSANCPEYVIAEYGSYWHSLVVVPIYDTLGPNACSYISNQAEIECIICDKLERIQIILSQATVLKSIRYLIIFEDIPHSYKQKASSHGMKVLTVQEVETLGKSKPMQAQKPKPADLAIVCFTSGTTDVPKGVMLSHGNVIANVSAVMYQMMEYTIRQDDVLMSYLPLAHMFERCCENALFMVGGSVVFFSGDVKVLSDDMKIAKPTLLPAVPRLLTRIYCKIQDSVKSNVIKSLLLNTAYHFKQKDFERTGHHSPGHTVRENLGGRVRLVMSGSAPLNPNVLEFLRCALGAVVIEGYGQTECCAPCTVTFPRDVRTGHVGPPIAAAAIKLADVPDMGYYAADGKGEVLVRGPIVFQGYFKDPERTAATLDTDGWLHTGDIGQWTVQETLKIVDRRKNIFKLSQGEYIAPEKIENTYSQCTLVAQVFVYGESLKSTLVGIVVPDQVVLEIWCRNNNINGTFSEMCRNKDVKKMLLKELHCLGQRDGLKSFEQVKDIHIDAELFTVENGLLTPTMKSRREEIYKHFKRQIDQLYSKLDFNLFIAFVLSGVSLYYYVIRKKSQKSIEKFKEVCDKLDYDHQSAELEENGAQVRISKYGERTERGEVKYLTYYFEQCKTMYDVVPHGAKKSIDGLSVGNINSTRTGVDWVSFEVVLRRSKHFADGLLQLGIQPKATFGIYSINSAEYTMAEYSCYRHSIVVIPIYETLGSNVCVFIAKQAKLTAIFCDTLTRVDGVLKNVKECDTLKHIIVASAGSDAALQAMKEKAVSYVHSMDDIEGLGKINPQADHPPEANDLAVICYTSGTTDAPKGMF
ncbi:hypothetical protein TYRP_001984, partial [Tyrophagus putrescentiae]